MFVTHGCNIVIIPVWTTNRPSGGPGPPIIIIANYGPRYDLPFPTFTPREMAGAGVVVGIAGGAAPSLVTRQGGEVVVFGRGAVIQEEDEEGDELGEPVIDADGCLGLGADVG